jgi:hypothetical protein
VFEFLRNVNFYGSYLWVRTVFVNSLQHTSVTYHIFNKLRKHVETTRDHVISLSVISALRISWADLRFSYTLRQAFYSRRDAASVVERTSAEANISGANIVYRYRFRDSRTTNFAFVLTCSRGRPYAGETAKCFDYKKKKHISYGTCSHLSTSITFLSATRTRLARSV